MDRKDYYIENGHKEPNNKVKEDYCYDEPYDAGWYEIVGVDEFLNVMTELKGTRLTQEQVDRYVSVFFKYSVEAD